MKIPSELDGARLNVARTAALVSMDSGHFRRLVRRGVFPAPKRTSKGMPFFDFELLSQIGEVLKSGIGLTGEEISFYRRKPKPGRRGSTRSRQRRQRAANQPDAYVEAVLEGCRQVGVGDDLLSVEAVASLLRTEFGGDRPELQEVIPVIARRLLAGE